MDPSAVCVQTAHSFVPGSVTAKAVTRHECRLTVERLYVL